MRTRNSLTTNRSTQNAVLTGKKRKQLKDSDFALPEERKYPIYDRAHAANALSRVAQNGTPEEKKRVRAAVHRKYPDLGGSDSTNNSTGRYEELTFNLTPGVNVRRQQFEGRNYTVVPMVMITEGVHDGSNGPLYYPEDELNKTPAVWNHKPVVVYHPSGGRSACDVAVLESSKVGIIMNTKYSPARNGKPGKLRGEAWLDMERLAKIDGRVAKAVANRSAMEVSTGLFMDFEDSEGYFGKKRKFYETIARNYRPDHLAILPDQKGACSVEDGAGLLMNSASPRSGVARAGEGFVVYKDGGRLYKQPCSVDEGKLTLNGNPSPIRKPKTPSGDRTMNKKHLVNALITNASLGFEEKDRNWLMGLSDKQLKKMVPAEEEADETTENASGPETEDDDDEKSGDDEEEGVTENASDGNDDEDMENEKPPVKKGKGDKGGKAKKKPPMSKNSRKAEESYEDDESEIVENRKPARQAVQPARLNTDDYLKTLPKDVRRVVSNALKTEEREKNRLIGIITSNAANTFKKQFLLTKSTEELGALAKLAQSGVPDSESNFTMAGGDVVDNSAEDDGVLELPSWDFSGNGSGGSKAKKEEVEA